MDKLTLLFVSVGINLSNIVIIILINFDKVITKVPGWFSFVFLLCQLVCLFCLLYNEVKKINSTKETVIKEEYKINNNDNQLLNEHVYVPTNSNNLHPVYIDTNIPK
jgi:hypothetical protein